MEDIAPGLIKTVTSEFHRLYDGSSRIQSLLAKIMDGTATYAEAQDYSVEVSKLIGAAYEKHISSAVLPDGRMYYNIAQRLIPSTLDENHSLVSEYAAKVQQELNRKAGISLKVQTAELNQDRVDGLVDLVSNAERYDEVSAQLLTAFENFSQNVVDETIRRNAEFHYQTGMSPKIIRRAEGKCCAWCRRLAGIYDYPDVDMAVYQRHGNCRCTVLYDPADGKKTVQNVHSKQWTNADERDIIEERRKAGLSDLGVFRPNDHHQTIYKYVSINRTNVVDAAKSGKRHSGVYLDAMSKSKRELQRSIINRVSQVERHADKIQHPESYVADWDHHDPRYQAGLLSKWEKDMRRNAEQAEIELSVFEERF